MRRSERQYSEDEDDGIIDFSIAGDAEEQNRIQLERELQDLSIALSITNPSQASENEINDQNHPENHPHAHYEGEIDETYSLEYPRHNSGVNDVSIFHGYDSSVADRSHLTNDYDPHFYSHPTADVDGGYQIYGGDTISTAAHHASALTLTAGLTGKSGRRRAHVSDASLSGAEYDADRPSENLVNDMRRDLNLLDMNSTRSRTHSKIQVSTQSKPMVSGAVNSNAELYGRQPEKLRNTMAEMSQSAQPRSPFTKRNHSPHQKLSTALHKVGNTFSPKRPRGLQHSVQNIVSEDEPTPRAKPNVKNVNVAIQPPTPSIGSQFSRMARDLAKDIEASQRQAAQLTNDRVLAHSTTKQSRNLQRNPLHDIANQSLVLDHRKTEPPSQKSDFEDNSVRRSRNVRSRNGAHFYRGNEKAQLPDVTGLTSAVGTPLKARNEWQKYILNDNDNHVESYFIRTLTALQTQLNQLESQNLVSRRRIRELEMELEACKLEIKREKTRVLEREEIIVAQQKEAERSWKGKGKAKKTDESYADENRYREVVEEKKALEALITTLRTHLTRLTAELSSHQALLAELRVLRDADQKIMQEKMSEVDKLTAEVERLSEEVEVLRGVVEQGLQERRRAREDVDLPLAASQMINDNDQPTQDELSDADNSEIEEQSRSVTPTPSSRPQSRLHQYTDKTMRTDHATAGTSNLGVSAVQQFYEPQASRDSSPDVDQGEVEQYERQISPAHSFSFQPATQVQNAAYTGQTQAKPSTRTNTRTPEQTPQRQMSAKGYPEYRTPFPQIRGERLERLFFSAPDHNARTCTVCHRRRRPSSPSNEDSRIPWSRPEGHLERAEELDARNKNADEIADNPRDRNRASDGGDRPPPQTILTRVLRDLEDDFTHYKAIYIELAEQYKDMDAVSNVPKRNVLAEHLKEVINTLERKGDQIAQLYDLLTFEDRPVALPAAPTSESQRPATLWNRSMGRRL